MIPEHFFSGWGAIPKIQPATVNPELELFKPEFRKFLVQVFLMRMSAWSQIRSLELELTTRCANNCPYCGNASGGPVHDLPLETIKRILLKSAEEGTLPDQISLAGGDPLLYPDFEKLVSFISGLGVDIHLKANTSTFNRSVGLFLKRNRCSALKFTLFGGLKHHDANRGRDTFKSLIEKSRLARKLGITLVWNLTLDAGTLDDALETLPIALKHGVRGVTLARVASIGRRNDSSSSDSLIQAEEFRSFLIELLKFQQEQNPSKFMIFFKEKLWFPLLCELGIIDPQALLAALPQQENSNPGTQRHGCEAYGQALTLTPQGNILACGLMRGMVMGNISDYQTLPWDLWKSHLAPGGPESCNGCEYLPFCRGCRGVAMACEETCDQPCGQHGIDPQCWILARKKL